MYRRNPARRLSFVAVCALFMMLVLSACGDGSATPTEQTGAAATNAPATTAPVIADATQSSRPTATVAASIPTVTAAPPTKAGTSAPAPTKAATTAPAQATTALTKVATTAPATSVPATTAPAATRYGGTIVYEEIGSTPDSPHTIYAADPNGGGRIKIGEGRSPLISPDSNQVAYLASLPTDEPFGKIAIRIAKTDGSGKVEDICEGAGNADIHLVRWSPRNRYIVMSATQNFGPGGVYLCNLQTKKQEQELQFGKENVTAPFDYTPDGSNVIWQGGVYQTDHKPTIYYGDPDKKGANAVAVVDPTNALTTNSGVYYTAARVAQSGKTIAIAGKKVVFASVPGQNSPLNGKTLDISGTPQHIAWSPDGGALAVSFVNSSGAYLSIFDLVSSKQTTIGGNIILGDWSRQ